MDVVADGITKHFGNEYLCFNVNFNIFSIHDKKILFIQLFLFRSVIKQGGIDTETSYPYTGTDYYKQCKYNPNTIGAKIKTFQNVGPFGSEEALAKAVAENGPVSVAVDASGFHHYRGGIYYERYCRNDASGLNHAVLVVGYGPNYWIVKNSYGVGWGDSGYIYMSRNRQNNCGIADYPSYPIA